MRTCLLVAVLVINLISVAHVAHAADRPTSEWVRRGADGKLAYKTTPAGDRIMDFSYAGYRGGGVALPDVPVKRTVKPSGGEDETKAIQSAIDEVAKLPLDANGFRGAVLLEPGEFPCAETITINASGIVLRGSGSTEERRSTIKMTGKPHLAIAARMGGGRGAASQATSQAEGEDAVAITDAYVPSGALSFTVADAKKFAVGDAIIIRRPVTKAWVEFMQMHDMTRDGKPQTWIKAGSTTTTERRITAIDGNKITLDVPLSDSFDAKYLNPPGASVIKAPPTQRLSQAGIENLHIESPLQEISHSQPHHTAIRLNGEDCWIKNLIIDETMNSLSVGGRRITVQDVHIIRKAKHQGASKPAELAPNGSQVLLDRCSVTGENIWHVATGAGISGPIVVLNCTFRGNGKSESHQRWSTGLLYDNCRAIGGGMEMRNRGSMGSGHGWSMGWGVFWNCSANDFLVQNPPGVMNWLIGSVGGTKTAPRPFGSGPPLAEGTIDSHGTPVDPSSLYLAQLEARLGKQALKNIGYDSAEIKTTAPETSRVPSSRTGAVDLAIDRPVSTSNTRDNNRKFAGWNALDGDDSTYWAIDDNAKLPATLELDTEGSVDINTVAIEAAEGFKNRVQQYKVEGMTDSAWKPLAEGMQIGSSRVHRFPKTTVWKVRLTIQKTSAYPAIRKLGLYLDETGK